jgi:hypothetical protein
MNSYLIKYKYTNKFFKLFGGYDYDDCCCGGFCGCCGSSHSSYAVQELEKGVQLLGGYDYDDCCCGGSCGCCGGGHSKNTSDKNINSFVINTKRADIPLA